MNRRDAIAGLVAATAATAAASVGMAQAAAADAILVTLCSRFEANERLYNSHFAEGSNEIIDDDEREAVTGPILADQEVLAGEIASLPITSARGFAAVAKCLGAWDTTIGDPQDHTGVSEQLIAALVKSARAMS